MPHKNPHPVIPLAPKEYTQWYMDRLVAVLTKLKNDIHSVAEVRGATLVVTDLPTSGVGKATGTVFRDQYGQLFVVMDNIGWTEGLSATASVGSVTTSP